MKKVSWNVKAGRFGWETKIIRGELLGFVKGWFFTYAIVNPLETCIEGDNSVWKNCPIKIQLSKIQMDN